MSGDDGSIHGDVDIGAIESYQDEPLASDDSSESEIEPDYEDPNNIPRNILGQRFERIISVQN